PKTKKPHKKPHKTTKNPPPKTQKTKHPTNNTPQKQKKQKTPPKKTPKTPFQRTIPPPPSDPTDSTPKNIKTEEPLPTELSFEEERKRYYSLLLERFPTYLWNLSYVRNLIRTQVLNEIPVSQKYREFLEVYDDWKMAQEVEIYGSPVKYSLEECEAILQQYQILLKQFPIGKWDLVKLGDRAREYSVKGKNLSPQDMEFFSNYDNWSRAKKANEALKNGSAQEESKRRQNTPTKKKPAEEKTEDPEKSSSDE
ncbi:MAG: hypothetical protein AABZ60_25475, partial [Planctomycetota bacterium]